ncbi:MAG: nucleotidyltransferase family protein [Candidatus Sumerlaeaceae bacterium]|nr:nucleotidyltransferase family protein [Candidatus Sumerlaeaceae bacterium]
MMPAGPTQIAIMLTRRCNMACGHCSVESSPDVKGDPTEDQVLSWFRDAAAAGVAGIQLTGGEPMLRQNLVLRLIREGQRLGVATVLSTNGFWGKSPGAARKIVGQLLDAGLCGLTVSYDQYHADFLAAEAVENIANAVAARNFEINVTITRLANDPAVQPIVDRFEKLTHVNLRFYDIQPIGRAREFPGETLRTETTGFCNACTRPAVTEDGRMTACNGPAFFEPPGSPLHLGSLGSESMDTLLRRHWEDPILDTIRTSGPAGLREELLKIPGFDQFPFRPQYHGVCDLCLHITSNPPAVKALRERLSDPQRTAARQAKYTVIEHARRHFGKLNRSQVNGPGASLVLAGLLRGDMAAFESEAESTLGRADLDWNRLSHYIAECGLASAVMNHPERHRLDHWAPDFLFTRLREAALRDQMRGMIHREVADRIATALSEMGVRGVILKGWAFQALEESAGGQSLRVPGDLDIYVEPAAAEGLRRKLIAEGFGGDPHAKRTGPHHLAPVTYRGVMVEIHTNIVASFWALPEKALLARAQPVPGKAPLFTLDGEGNLLHLGIHATAHFFSHGLKHGMDVFRVLRHFGNLDWEYIANAANHSACPRAFWTPMRVLNEDLKLGLPAELLARGPNDQRQKRLDLVAGNRLFVAAEKAYDLNPITRNGLFLMMFDSWMGRLRYVAEWAGGDTAEARRNAMETQPGQAVSQLPRYLRQSLADWRRYRGAVRKVSEDFGM